MLSTDIIFNYNRLWRQLYYDALYEFDGYQISVCAAEPQGYYNAIHGLREIDQKTLERIVEVEKKHGVKLGIFVAAEDADKFADALNWKSKPEEDENWWVFNLDKASCLDSALAESLNVSTFDPENHAALDNFLQIDGIANSLSPAVIETLRKHITTRNDHPNIFFTGRAEGQACACGTLGVVGDTAYLAEGGVLPAFRQRGFHKAMTAHRLIEAEKYASNAVMVCSAYAESNHTARSLGFELVGTRRYFERI